MQKNIYGNQDYRAKIMLFAPEDGHLVQLMWRLLAFFWRFQKSDVYLPLENHLIQVLKVAQPL